MDSHWEQLLIQVSLDSRVNEAAIPGSAGIGRQASRYLAAEGG